VLQQGRSMTLDEYRTTIIRREEARARMAALATIGDALITLTSPGPAPLFEPPAKPDNRVPYGTTGPTTFNVATSILGVPAVTIPLLSVDGMPVGVQIIGQQNADNQATGIARWVYENVKPVIA
jgi:Asp-tRNA(Asn)/Glu-tRNA(Gln) amidotransferase A subunit family amidase